MLKYAVFTLIFFAQSALSDGIITGINFSGAYDSAHKNIVQIQIQGGYSTSNCNSRFAAIRNTQEQQQMISFALAAFMEKTPVTIVISSNDKYYGDRCTITRISSVY